MNTVLLVDDGGTEAEAVRWFGNDRVIVKYRGIYVFADRVSAATFELSGEPARPGAELVALSELAATVETTTTVAE